MNISIGPYVSLLAAYLRPQARRVVLLALLLLASIAASAAVGLSVLVVAFVVVNALSADGPEAEDEWRYDATRIGELRRVSPLYRFFQPLITARASAGLTWRASERPCSSSLSTDSVSPVS